MALTAKPYLRSLSIRNDDDIDTSCYPFSIPAVRSMAGVRRLVAAR